MPFLIDSISIDLGSGTCLLSGAAILPLSASPGLLFKLGKGGGGGAFITIFEGSCGIGGGGGGGGKLGDGAGDGATDGGGGLDGSDL